MDMWNPYILSVEKIMPIADIVHDNFHVIKYLNKGVDEVRKSEVKGNNELKNTKYIFLKKKENWTQNQYLKFQEINKLNLKSANAWRIKENFKEIYTFWNPLHCLTTLKIGTKM